jgi:beta-D-xylosidase 4
MALAREAARQAIVLLFNPNNVLPINASTVQRVAVIGPVADSQVVNGGRNYAGVPCGGRAQTILDAFKQSSYLFDVQYVAGCSDVQCANATEFNHAKTAAANADLTIVVLGIDETVENEGLDRVDLMLPGLQGSLAAAVCGAARGPCVLALIGGGAVDIDDFINSTAAAFHLGLPGGNGASAFVDVVFGDTTPAGRLTQTFYSRSFVDEISMFEMGVRPGLSKFPPFSNPGRTYQWYTGNPSFVFGHGLSYTNWTLSVVPSSAPRRVSLRHVQQYLDASPEFGSAFAPIRSSSLLSFSINITNIGPRASEFVLLAMSIPPDGGTKGIPQQTLNGFDRVSLAVGSSAIVPVDVLARTFTAVKLDDDDASPFRARRVAVPGVYKFRFGVGDMAVETELLVENDL